MSFMIEFRPGKLDSQEPGLGMIQYEDEIPSV